jgi:hypothetical protein
MDQAMHLIAETGVALRRELIGFGVTDRELAASLRHGVLRRVRQGAYTTPDRWDTVTNVARHKLRCTSVMRSLGPRVALSHTSSLVMQDVPVWAANLDVVHVTRLDGGMGRTDAGVHHHEGQIDRSDLVATSDGLVVTSSARAVIEHGTLHSMESTLVSADAALHLGRCSGQELVDQFARMERWPGTQHLQIVVRLADGRSESPGETRSRFLCWRHGLPAPELQFEVYDEDGHLVGISDFAWPEHRLLGEFDGRMKYGRGLAPGQDPSDAVFSEKRREDRLREITQWAMVRLVWGDLELGGYTANRIRQLMLRAA